MKVSKAGLADLKRLRVLAEAARREKEARQPPQAPAAMLEKKAPPLSKEAVRLFARATQLVEPLRAGGRVLHARTQQSSDADLLAQKRSRAAGLNEHAVAGIAKQLNRPISDSFTPISDTGEDMAWHAQGIGPDTLRKLKQAWWPVGAQLDLHGQTREQAREALLTFIAASQQHGTRCVRIIHGQGFGSQSGEAVLRSQVAQWLTQIEAVSAFATAPKAHGGRGALLALIRLA